MAAGKQGQEAGTMRCDDEAPMGMKNVANAQAIADRWNAKGM